MIIVPNGVFVHFLCLSKENEPKEKTLFLRYFALSGKKFLSEELFSFVEPVLSDSRRISLDKQIDARRFTSSRKLKITRVKKSKEHD